MAGKPDVPRRGWRLEGPVLAIGASWKQSSGDWLCCWAPSTLLLLGQGLLKTRSKTCTVQALCMGENHSIWAWRVFPRNQDSEPHWHQGCLFFNVLLQCPSQWDSLQRPSSPLYRQSFTTCLLVTEYSRRAHIHSHRAGCKGWIWSWEARNALTTDTMHNQKMME